MRKETTAIVLDDDRVHLTTDTDPAFFRSFGPHLSHFSIIEKAVISSLPKAVNVVSIGKLRRCGESTDYAVTYNTTG